ncbi:MAG: WYL domain-containing protein [Salinivirgaceae bacterium]|nr:WYL domain-containing protein [Salinivirgaceae bacterium]
MVKSTTGHLYRCYAWLVDTIDQHPNGISLEEINKLWGINKDVNEGEEKYIVESKFHRWRRAAEEFFGIEIVCDSNGCYSIANHDNSSLYKIARQTLNAFAVSNIIKGNQSLDKQILYEDVPSSQQYLTTILSALRNRHILKMTHQSFWHKEPTYPTVEPYSLKMFRQRWYLLAKVLDNSKKDDIGKLRTYGLDRIVSAVETDDSYTMPDNFEANNIFANLVGISGIGNKIEEVKIVVEEEQAKYLRTLPLHHSQKEVWTGDWESEFDYKLIVNEEFMRELRAYGPSLEVLEPEWLREDFRKEAERTLRAYKKTKGKN